MKRGNLIWCALLLLHNTTSSSQDAVSLVFNPIFKTERSFFRLGDQVLTLRTVTASEDPSFVLVSLHDDEKTSKEAAQLYLQKKGGQFIVLDNKDRHSIHFDFRGLKYSVDPNLIFSAKSRSKPLREVKYSYVLTKQLENLARYIEESLPQYKPVVALHNDHDHSINHYKKNIRGRQVRDCNVNSERNEYDYFMTADLKLFEALKEKNFNVVLIDKPYSKDEGTLRSIYLNGSRRYIDVVTREGQPAEQLEMIEVAGEVLMEKKNI